MNLESIEYRPLTVDEVLELLRQLPDFDFDWLWFEDLHFDTSLAQWAKWCKLPQIPLTLPFVRECMYADLSEAEWREATEPADQRTVGHVCEAIARSTRKAVVPTVRILGKECRSAGAFLLVKKLLADTGVSVSGVAPSTHLSCYADKGFPQLRREISFLCPDLWGRLHAIDWRPMFAALVITSFFLPLVFADSSFLKDAFGWFFFWCICCSGFKCLLLRCGLIEPFDRARFPRMKTFRDLSVAIARIAERGEVSPRGCPATS